MSPAETTFDNEIRIVCWNVEHNGRGRHGGEDHRDLARDILASLKPHVVLRQELTGAWDRGKADLYAEANRLGGLTPFMAAPREGRSRNPVGVMIDPNLFFVDGEFEHDMPWKPICNPRVRLKGCAKPIDLASAHLCHCDPDLRATEARRLTTLADNSRSALVGMDANSYPHQAELESVTLPDWDTVEDRVHYQHRTIERAGRRVSDTRPDEILSGGDPVFTDLGLHAARVLGQPGALAATASLKRTDQGPAQRIDRMYCTPTSRRPCSASRSWQPTTCERSPTTPYSSRDSASTSFADPSPPPAGTSASGENPCSSTRRSATSRTTAAATAHCGSGRTTGSRRSACICSFGRRCGTPRTTATSSRTRPKPCSAWPD